MSQNENPSVKATVKDFAERIKGEGLSPTMREIQVAIAVERLREEHGIKVNPDKFAQLVNN